MFGVAGFVVVFARTRALLPSLAVALDFFLAAGLLRLTGDATVEQVLVAAIVLAVQRLAGAALRRGAARPADQARQPG